MYYTCTFRARISAVELVQVLNRSYNFTVERVYVSNIYYTCSVERVYVLYTYYTCTVGSIYVLCEVQKYCRVDSDLECPSARLGIRLFAHVQLL